MNPIAKLVQKFAADIQAVIDAEREAVAKANYEATQRTLARIAIMSGGLGRLTKKTRRKGPIQICPVPKCTNRAAPVYGMVCARHKDVSKLVIKRYRAVRAAKKAKGK